MKENPVTSLPGIPFLLAVLATAAVSAWLVATGIGPDPDNLGVASGASILGGLLLGALAFFSLVGLYKVEPNQAAVLSLFGRYVGTVKTDGLRWNNPFFSKKKISLRVRNFESGKLKVNELDGSPIEIAAVIVWQVQDSAEAVYNVDDYESFVHIQSESALRAMATSYPYDAPEEEGISLRHSVGEVTDRLRHEVQDRLAKAGIEVLEARISHLAYAPEIAGAMLRRQQAGAIVAARQKIVEGAIGMVEQALHELNARQVIELDPERKAAMVSNLLVVLCSDRAVEPVVNAGTLYQ